MPQEEEKPLRNQHLSFAKRLMEYLMVQNHCFKRKKEIFQAYEMSNSPNPIEILCMPKRMCYKSNES